MKAPAPGKKVGAANAPKKAAAAKQAKQAKQANKLITDYSKYFSAPAATPDFFRILDLTEGAEISYSSHT